MAYYAYLETGSSFDQILWSQHGSHTLPCHSTHANDWYKLGTWPRLDQSQPFPEIFEHGVYTTNGIPFSIIDELKVQIGCLCCWYVEGRTGFLTEKVKSTFRKKQGQEV